MTDVVPDWKQRIEDARRLLKISNEITRVVAEAARFNLVSREIVEEYYSALSDYEDALKAYAQVRSIYTLVMP